MSIRGLSASICVLLRTPLLERRIMGGCNYCLVKTKYFLVIDIVHML